MATTDRRNVLRSLPALIALLAALFLAPQATAAPSAGSDARVSHSIAVEADTPATETTTTTTTAVVQMVSTVDEPVADHTGVLETQRSTGPAGSRAPPAAS